MEYLIELKKNTELSTDVLNAWAKQGKNAYYGGWIDDPNLYITIFKTKIVEISEINNHFQVHDGGKKNIHFFKLAGFIKFYNNFYKIKTGNDNFKLGKEEVSIPISNEETGKLVLEALVKLGCKPYKNLPYNAKSYEVWKDGSVTWSSTSNYGENNNLKVISSDEILKLVNKKTTNKINLNKKANEKRIVFKPITTITRGKRPTGTSVSGKASRVTITVGHLRNRTINF